MTVAAARTELWASPVAANLHLGVAPSSRRRALSRAATRALRLPMVAPDTKHPPAVDGHPARDASHANAWFSAAMAPAPASQVPANISAALTARSKTSAASVGAAGT